jgi:phospholipase C
MADPQSVDTIIVVILENRSFDHILGYLSLPDYGRDEVEGLRTDGTHLPSVWPPQFVLPGPYSPFRMPSPHQPLPNNMDPPHERPNIAIQIGAQVGGTYPMKGFIQSYGDKINVGGVNQPVVMGYFTGEDLPTTHFFSENFLICDHWFSSLPAGTQPNRLVAMSGMSRIDLNRQGLIPEQTLVFKWLTDRHVRWRVYTEGIPFFSLMKSQWPAIFIPKFYRPFPNLAIDIKNEPATTFPQVIFVEPRYTNAPHVDTPHDDHAPSAVDGGQRFLMEVYAALTANPARWKKSVMIVTYDEHGGFFDHVSPPRVPTPAPGGAYPAFESLGVRVPTFIISPFVEPRSVYHHDMDHTSILQFLGERFGNGHYSAAVDSRMSAGLESVSAVLSLSTAREDIPSPPSVSQGFTPQAVPYDAMSLAFGEAFARMNAKFPDKVSERFPKLSGHFGEPPSAPKLERPAAAKPKLAAAKPKLAAAKPKLAAAKPKKAASKKKKKP